MSNQNRVDVQEKCTSHLHTFTSRGPFHRIATLVPGVPVALILSLKTRFLSLQEGSQAGVSTARSCPVSSASFIRNISSAFLLLGTWTCLKNPVAPVLPAVCGKFLVLCLKFPGDEIEVMGSDYWTGEAVSFTACHIGDSHCLPVCDWGCSLWPPI
uniref:Uncharacterized protein n=1 Tax=Molossus molossus TaxID=27622 RepID=A0A7J8CZI4_MOLMO|nr:hypothetical protein HJG59_009443 [Molossus molossus]